MTSYTSNVDTHSVTNALKSECECKYDIPGERIKFVLEWGHMLIYHPLALDTMCRVKFKHGGAFLSLGNLLLYT